MDGPERTDLEKSSGILGQALEEEAACFGRYLLGKPANRHSIDLYVKAMSTLEVPVNREDQRRLEFVLKHPRSLPWVDGGLALTAPASAIRSKLLVMLGILECQPAYTAWFLPRAFSAADCARVLLASASAAVRGILGLLLLKFI